jgi:hypothetical protein
MLGIRNKKLGDKIITQFSSGEKWIQIFKAKTTGLLFKNHSMLAFCFLKINLHR